MKLKPCPFCKKQAIQKDMVAECVRCGASAPLGFWNDRPIENELNRIISTYERAEEERFILDDLDEW
jgi:hypothetical protein